MILAEKILKLRKSNGWSQEDLAGKMNVSRQSISKWESAASIPDISKILELANLFGVTTDYLLKDDLEETAYLSDADTGIARVSLDKANDFISGMLSYGKKTGLGVMLCILSPVPLILIAGLYDKLFGRYFGDLIYGIGVVILLLAIAGAVAVFISSSEKMKRFKYLKSADYELEYGVSGILSARLNSYESKYTRNIIIGVAMCILSVVPLIIASLLDASDITIISLTALLFVIIAIAVYILITAGIEKESFDILLREADFSPVECQRNSNKFAGIYWLAVTAIYIVWSFLFTSWSISWILWPVAGIIFVAVLIAIKKN